ncbi:hypothetical protein [Streptomyces acidiscabies]|uniref:HEAT repeat domain-containing protein n=1 Tax=Streptomyces acidiscabies TaxID=42234 RepID=A0A0L0K1C1_9ACTN|nr:hypothetical protein [Streptomyces acidiscabies]KND31882.1 hypothetical protein IQ63_25065 [Streptomyces acidiscabies]
MRTEKLADLASGDTVRATRALLYLTYEDPDRRWLEGLLLDQVREGNEPQLRLLAVTCMGHLGRMRGAVGAEVVACLERLLGEPELGGVAEDALGDVGWFAEVAPGE